MPYTYVTVSHAFSQFAKNSATCKVHMTNGRLNSVTKSIYFHEILWKCNKESVGGRPKNSVTETQGKLLPSPRKAQKWSTLLLMILWPNIEPNRNTCGTQTKRQESQICTYYTNMVRFTLNSQTYRLTYLRLRVNYKSKCGLVIV